MPGFHCQTCSFLNEDDGPACEVCGSLRGGGGGLPWVCAVCTLQNAAGAAACAACGTPNPAAPAASSTPPTTTAASTDAAPWACGVCTYRNAAARTDCEMCGLPRPGGGGGGGGAAAPSAATTTGADSTKFTLEQLSDTVYKVVEDDRFGQYPFLYIIVGADKIVVIDTGCDTADFRSFVDEQINTDGKPYVVINTHVHFDHVGGNHRFAGSPILMGDRRRPYSENYPLTSLCSAHNTTVVPFEVTEWCADGHVVPLDDANPAPEAGLHILHTPGHTLDSISIHYPAEQRLFVGDLVYPWTAINLSTVGSAVSDYLASVKRLQAFVAERGVRFLSCGHVEANLAPSALDDALALVQGVRAGTVQPSGIEADSVAVYTRDSLTVLIPTDVKWDAPS